VFRLVTRAEPAFLVEMLYEAVYWHDDGQEERPPLDAMITEPRNARYVEEWGRAGDLAIIALDRQEEAIGAAWCRCFSADAPGYGFVAADVPELAIAVFPEFRRSGVGSLLLGALIARSRAAGTRAMSLSVARANPARALYERHGFVVTREEGTADTMLLDLRSA
jgi:ribosomal protein S18 acetylase RimI-like enzyme